jgi:uncharacterized tellurite resistance protein B-like protein
MSNEQLIITLAKVLIAAAWTDGELTLEETNSMKDLLFRLPELSARQWASVQMYIESPVGEAERTRLVEDLRAAIASPADRELALNSLQAMMEADGKVSAKEEAVMAEIVAAIESVDVGVLGRLFKGMTGRHARSVANAPNREDYFEDFLSNKVYYGVRRRLDLGEAELKVSDGTLRTLSLAGGVMARVAQVNPQVTDAEVDTMVEALQPEEAAFVAGVAVSETASLLDQSRLVREFADACGPEERAEFLDVLFAVAAADGEATYDEIEELRTIARWLKLSHEQFIEAKLKIPRDRRGQ